MADAVTATLTQRNGEIKEYKEIVAKESKQEGNKLDGLLNSLTKMQKEVNDSLTELVEAERGNMTNSSKHSQDDNLDDDDEGEDDDDDDNHDQNSHTNTDRNNSEPSPKKLKT